jgi:hypothetical protein
MAKWKYKCIGCGKKVPVVCTNCSRKEFKGKKNKNSLWFECSHCKERMDSFSHNCVSGSYIEKNDKTARTDLNLHRKNFFRSDSSGSELPGGMLFPILFFSMIILLLIILL